MLCTGLLLIARFFYTGAKQYLLYFFLLICPLSFAMGLGPDKDYFLACAYVLSFGLMLRLNSTKTWVSYGIALASILFASLIRYDGILFLIPLIIFLAVSFFKIKQFNFRNILFLFGMVLLMDLSCFLFSQGFTYIKTHTLVPQGHLSEFLVPQIAAATLDKKILAGLNIPIMSYPKNYPSPLDYCKSYRDISYELFYATIFAKPCQKLDVHGYNSGILFQWLRCWSFSPWRMSRYLGYSTWKFQVLSLLQTDEVFQYKDLYSYLPEEFYPKIYMRLMNIPLLATLPLYGGTLVFLGLVLGILPLKFKDVLWSKLQVFVWKVFFILIFFIGVRFFIFTYVDYRFVALLPLFYWLAIGSTIFIFIERKIG
jgi:hypothetical protein